MPAFGPRGPLQTDIISASSRWSARTEKLLDQPIDNENRDPRDANCSSKWNPVGQSGWRVRLAWDHRRTILMLILILRGRYGDRAGHGASKHQVIINFVGKQLAHVINRALTGAVRVGCLHVRPIRDLQLRQLEFRISDFAIDRDVRKLDDQMLLVELSALVAVLSVHLVAAGEPNLIRPNLCESESFLQKKLNRHLEGSVPREEVSLRAINV
ncbi:MAG: hypothetical protein ACREJC_15470, partial [Tepidisphaeraceae bacterium]